MITAIHRKKLLPTLVMLFALAGMSLSVIGEAFSHGVAELAGTPELSQTDHPHSHAVHSHEIEDKSDVRQHHDSGNHTHESVDQRVIPLVSEAVISIRQTIPFAGESPHSFRYRLDRPPKAYLTV